MISLFSDWDEYMGGCLYNRHYWRILHIAGGWYLRFLDNNVIRLISVLYLHQLGRHACVRRPEQVEKQLIPHCIARANDCRKLPIFRRSAPTIRFNHPKKIWRTCKKNIGKLYRVPMRFCSNAKTSPTNVIMLLMLQKYFSWLPLTAHRTYVVFYRK